ncbi:MAG: GNAT family N-acetyltransferase [Acidobacteriota bacterium]|nr:GNAT family N-acetyltransferase [Acidobacteriota bacterium]
MSASKDSEMGGSGDAGVVRQEPGLAPVTAAETRPLRRAVLRPNQPPEACVYPGDDDDRTGHLGVFVDTGAEAPALVGVASIFEESRPGTTGGGWRIRGMAVVPEQQGKGHGAALLTECLEHARRHGGIEVWCNARKTAAEFYAHHGFEQEGEEFELPAIGPHYLMRCGLER